MAPDGDRIKLVGLTTTRNKNTDSVALTRANKEFQIHAITDDPRITSFEESVQLIGILSYADAKKRKIKLTDSNKKDYLIDVPQGLLSDIVKPYFEEIVTIQGLRKGTRIELVDIEKAEP